MIPSEVIKIFSGSMVSHIGSRDAKLQTTEAMGWGAKLDADKKVLTIFIPKSVSAKTLANVTSTKKLAVTVGEPLTHELYQFKGTYLGHFDASAEDEKLQDVYVQTFYDKFLKLFGFPESILSTFNYKPSIGLSFQVEEIFVQTPGPKAGSTIYKNEIAYGNR